MGVVPQSDAVDVLAETLAGSEEPITLVPLGPWTNLADLVKAHPDVLEHVAGIHAMAGAIDAPGNIAFEEVMPEHGVEWNVGVDPDAVAAVFETDIPVTLVPLDATNAVPVPADIATIVRRGPRGRRRRHSLADLHAIALADGGRVVLGHAGRARPRRSGAGHLGEHVSRRHDRRSVIR